MSGKPQRSLALIYNPAAGEGRWRPGIDKVVHALQHAGGKVELLPTRGPGDGVELARQAASRHTRIAVYGGDGSLNEVLNGISGLPEPPRILMLPGGTMNVLCRDLGIPLNAVEAAGLLATGVPKRIFLGMAKSAASRRYFALMAGVGLDAAVVHGMSDFARAKRLLGPWSFLLAGLRVVSGHTFPEIEVAVQDGNCETYHGREVIVGKSRGYAGWFSITDQADPGEPMFEVAVGRSPGSFAHVWRLTRAFFGRLKYSRTHQFAITKHVRMSSREPAFVQLDGEPAGPLPMEFTIDGTSVEVLVPPAEA